MVVDVTSASCAGRYPALNEAVLGKTPTGQIVRIAVLVDGEYFTTYHADGLIIATPTGSTAYAWSAGGPIISPVAEALLLTPVAPHMLFDRSMVLPRGTCVRLEVVADRSASPLGRRAQPRPPRRGRCRELHGLAHPGPARDVRHPQLPRHPEGQVRPERLVLGEADVLVELAVSDLGVLAELSLVFDDGLTAVTGETGAGKTLVVSRPSSCWSARGPTPAWSAPGRRRPGWRAASSPRPARRWCSAGWCRPRAAPGPTSTGTWRRSRPWPRSGPTWSTCTASTPTSPCSTRPRSGPPSTASPGSTWPRWPRPGPG